MNLYKCVGGGAFIQSIGLRQLHFIGKCTFTADGDGGKHEFSIIKIHRVVAG